MLCISNQARGNQRDSFNSVSGTMRGGKDVLDWTDTDQTAMTITGVDHKKEQHVTLTAINKAGLYTTRTYIVLYKPSVV